MSATSFINGFSEKILFLGKRATLGPKMACPHNFGFAVRIFLEFCIMIGAKKYMEIILMVFLKIFSFGANGPFWAKKCCILITLGLLYGLF